jgi:hypothetical protein
VADAIRAWLADYDLVYAGPCADTSLSEDVGKYCSTVLEDRGATLVAIVGPTFSEYTDFLLIEQTGNGWIVKRAAGVPPPDEAGGDWQLPF